MKVFILKGFVLGGMLLISLSGYASLTAKALGNKAGFVLSSTSPSPSSSQNKIVFNTPQDCANYFLYHTSAGKSCDLYNHTKSIFIQDNIVDQSTYRKGKLYVQCRREYTKVPSYVSIVCKDMQSNVNAGMQVVNCNGYIKYLSPEQTCHS